MNIQKIRDSFPGLTNSKLGELLFPGHKYPEKALARIMSGKSELTESQIRKLAAYLSMKPGELFEETLPGGWLDKSESLGLLTLQKGNYTAIYNPATGITLLSRQGIVVATKILTPKATLLSEYVKKLDEAIIECEIDALI